MTSTLHNARLTTALDIVAETAPLIMQHYQTAGLAVDRKADESPVTIADRDAETLMRERIRRAFPDDAILGEEHADVAGTSGYRWILDPIDGTKAFIHGVPLFGTLIGIEFEDQCVVGVCNLPVLDETISAETGQGCWWKRGPNALIRSRVSEVSTLAEALFCYTSVPLFERTDQREVFDRLRSACRITRGWGDCYGHILVATGRAELAVDPILNPWDCAALLPIVTEAGGHFCDWQGEASIHNSNGLSVNAALHDAVLTTIDH